MESNKAVSQKMKKENCHRIGQYYYWHISEEMQIRI
jgi:hypothetical protein